MTKIIGLTGGIGSGKTTISKYFSTKGIPVYISDIEAKKILKRKRTLKSIKDIFGNEVFEGDVLNKQKLSQIVFDDSNKLKQLNKIIHPAVKLHFNNWATKHADYPFIIKEAAILFESGSYKDCDIIITVVAPLEMRIQRVIKRDKVTEDDVLKRIKNQWTDNQRIKKSDFVIDNSDLKLAKKQVDKILKKLSII